MITKIKIPTNADIARLLDAIAELLEIQHADPHRIRAYRTGAKRVLDEDRPVAELVTSGDEEALQAIPGIGERLAGLIAEFVKTGRSQLLLRLQGEVTPEYLFEQVPGIGEELARRIIRELDIHTLEELEQAAHDGRLARVEGFGRRRLAAIQTSLAGILGKAGRRRLPQHRAEVKTPAPPGVDLLLQVDKDYRRKAAAGSLRRIAPKRFNPQGEAWLPIYHVDQDDWSLTAMFSNTARAHDLGKTDDWVVIYYEQDGWEGQSTVVTETSGSLTGKRVVRGRETECERVYES